MFYKLTHTAHENQLTYRCAAWRVCSVWRWRHREATWSTATVDRKLCSACAVAAAVWCAAPPLPVW